MDRQSRYLWVGLMFALLVMILRASAWLLLIVYLMMSLWSVASTRYKKLRYLLIGLMAAAYCGSICLGLVAFDAYGMAKSQIVNLTKDISKLNPDTDLFVIGDVLGRYGYMDNTGDVVIAPKFQVAESFSEGLAKVEVGDKWGYIDKTRSIVIQPQFSWAEDFSEGLACVETGDKMGSIDKTGKFVIPAQYSSVASFHGGYAQFSVSDEFFPKSNPISPLRGIIDKTGKVILKPEYTCISQESDGYFCVEDGDGKYGYLDSNYKVAIKPVYTKAEDFQNGLARVEDGDLWGLIDKQGNLKTPCQYNSISPFSEGLAAVENPDSHLWGYINTECKLVFPFQYLSNNNGELTQYTFEDGLACVPLNNKEQIVIDTTGKTVVQSFPRVRKHASDNEQGTDDLHTLYGYSGEGLHWAEEEPGKLTFFDNKGNVKFTTDGDAAGTFSDGLCSVARIATPYTDEYGFIDITGKRVIDFKYFDVEEFTNGLAQANELEYGYRYIDKTGRYVWLGEYYKVRLLQYAGVLLMIALALAAMIIYNSRKKV